MFTDEFPPEGYEKSYSIGTAINGDVRLVAGIGLGITVLGLPIHKSGVRKMRKGIDLFYNAAPKENPLSEPIEISLAMTSSGLGLLVLF